MKYKTPPKAHQARYMKDYAALPSAMLAAEMGTGKTWAAINNIAIWRITNACDAVIVFAPNGVTTNWANIEIPKHMPDCIAKRVCEYKRSAAGIRYFESMFHQDSFGLLRIAIFNWESLQHKNSVNDILRFANSAKKLAIILDESDCIKNPDSVRFKNLMKIEKFAKWKRAMTGTPINNSPFDFWAQYTFLDRNIFNGDSIFGFKATYSKMLTVHHPMVANLLAKRGIDPKSNLAKSKCPQIVAKDDFGRPIYRNLDKLAKIVSPITFVALKRDCLDLPQKIYATLQFDLTPQQRAYYNAAQRDLRLEIDAGVDVLTKLTSLGKLSQITSGYFIHKGSDEPVRIEGENPKMNLLIEEVGRIIAAGEKVIVWARYIIEIDDISRELRNIGANVAEYHGRVSPANREAAMLSFERGSANVFLATPSAAGVGLTLNAASNAIYYSNDFSYRKRAQSEDRNHRIGQTKAVRYVNIVGIGTIDEYAARAIEAKRDIAELMVANITSFGGIDILAK